MIRLIQRKMAKKTTNWKTKEIDGRRMMICQNSKPTMSKYSDINWEIYNLLPTHVEKHYI